MDNFKIKTSTEIGSISKIVGEEKAVEYVARAGFDAWDFSLFEMAKYDWQNHCVYDTGHILTTKECLSYARKLRKIGEDNGIICNQSHAPFPSRVPKIYEKLKTAIECTAEAGGNICIIHPDNNEAPEENAQMYFELLPFARDCGVKIATENMWNWDNEKGKVAFAACSTPESFNAHLDAVNDEFFVACLDIGHAEMRDIGTSAVEMIYALGDRLKALHVHDTDRIGDNHQIPFSMKIDFDAVIKALKDIGYDGYLTLEADQYLSKRCKRTAFLGVKQMAKVARVLADKFNSL
ncbi:MAG: sugar phosphate isomerase/epimerase [Clostridia bacterium]|nr:sugar phosphate isomerase/epimerase [Clostridia bacterium]